jgi:hypothetical protein
VDRVDVIADDRVGRHGHVERFGGDEQPATAQSLGGCDEMALTRNY